jgi:Mandelate racemase / muconate lactonizing enzyme, N-terminal domain/Enolase C-terminal domain-like
MKITAITTQEYRWPRAKPITNGLHTYSHVDFALVKIETDAGVTGIGLGNGGTIWRAAVAQLGSLLIGEDPIDVERLWHKMWVPKLTGRRGLVTRAISSIDIGLWDIRGKVANLPLYKLLGGFRDRVPTYIAGGYYEEGKGLRELAQEMEQNLRMNAKAVKIKVGGVSIREDIERIRTVRETIGPDVKLLIDANCAYRAAGRLRRPPQAGAGDDHSDRDGGERVHPLWLPRPDQARRRGDLQPRRQNPRRRHRVHEGGRPGAVGRSGHRAAWLAGHPHPPGGGDPQRPYPGVLS